jgi:hypothetical protein
LLIKFSNNVREEKAMDYKLKMSLREAIGVVISTEEIGFTEETFSVASPRTLFMIAIGMIKKNRELSSKECEEMYQEFPSILKEMRISIADAGGREKSPPYHWKPNRNMMRGAARVDYRNRMILKYDE